MTLVLCIVLGAATFAVGVALTEAHRSLQEARSWQKLCRDTEKELSELREALTALRDTYCPGIPFYWEDQAADEFVEEAKRIIGGKK